MKVGLVVPQFGINSTKENLIRFVQIAESEGFESLWVYDRMLYAINPQQPYPGTPNKREWTEHFENVLDPLTTLAFIAANTTKVKLGTCIIDMLFHNPITALWIHCRLSTLWRSNLTSYQLSINS